MRFSIKIFIMGMVIVLLMVWSSGGDNRDQLGDGTTTDKLLPTQESSSANNWSSIGVGEDHTVAIKSDGTLWAWGFNGYGQLGDGTTQDKYTPVQESSGSTDWSSVGAGGGNHSIAIKGDGTLWAWGDNNRGQLGDGTTTDKLLPTQESSSATDWSCVCAGENHTVAIKGDGTLWAWGFNSHGQLGDGTTKDKYTPVQESSGATDWSSVSAGEDYTVAIKSDGTLWSWGFNGYGQLGDGTTKERSVPIQESSGATDWSRVCAGEDHTVAIKGDGTLWAWGDNNRGQLGDGTTTDKLLPTQESSDATDWSRVSAGEDHTVAIKGDGTLWTWGFNAHGQLGDGTTKERSTLIQESSGATDWSYVGAGEDHTVAIKGDGTLWAWGDNNRGQLGDGMTTEDKLIPTQ